MAKDLRSIRFPLPLARSIDRLVGVQYLDFSSAVIDLCRRQLNVLEDKEYSKASAIYSRACFLVITELLAMAKKENVDTVRRSYLAKASRRDGRGITRLMQEADQEPGEDQEGGRGPGWKGH